MIAWLRIRGDSGRRGKAVLASDTHIKKDKAFEVGDRAARCCVDRVRLIPCACGCRGLFWALWLPKVIAALLSETIHDTVSRP